MRRGNGKGGPGRGGPLLFAATFFRHPALLGSIIPSSGYLCRKVANRIDWDSAARIVEFGPGVGTVSRHLIRHLEDGARLMLVERHPGFARYLKRSIHDDRVDVVEGCAYEFLDGGREGEPVDAIICGIPMSPMDPGRRFELLRSWGRALSPGGQLLIYQFRGAHLRRELPRVFRRVEEMREVRNLMPARIFDCREPFEGR